MASEYERRAWANLGPALGQAFRGWGQQRARRAEFDAQMAMAELERRDRKDQADRMYELEGEKLEIDKANIEDIMKRRDEDAERQAELDRIRTETTKLVGGYQRGGQAPADVGRIAGQELGGRIQEADGFLPGIRAAVAGVAPALQKGFAEAPATPYFNVGEFATKRGLSDEQVGLLYEAAPQLFEPNYTQMKSAAEMYVLYDTPLPPEWGYMKTKLDEAKGDIKAEKDYNKQIQGLDVTLKELQIDKLKNPRKYALSTGGGGVGGGDAASELTKLLKLRESLDLAGFDTSAIDATIEAMGFGKAGTEETGGEDEATDEAEAEVEINWGSYLNDFMTEHDPETIGDKMGLFKGSIGVVQKMYDEALNDMMAAIENGAPENVVTQMQAIVSDLKKRSDRLSTPESY